ncbi:hypothetical protein B6A42_27630 (plasmid) [Vibrio coralliilyticus]|nr:hypothetical protein B6A42_27630 [Vibrio coralliilyticus]
MAQQNSPQTRSNVNSATSVSPLEHESSPKNDSSSSAHAVSTHDFMLMSGTGGELKSQVRKSLNLARIQSFRKEHGLIREERQTHKHPMNYVCTEKACIDTIH